MRPGGMSSDEDSDDSFGGSFERIKDKSNLNELSKEDEFIKVVALKQIEKIKELIEKGVDVNYKPKGGWPAVLYASFDGSLEMLKLLVECGASLTKFGDKFTPLIAVCSSSNFNEEGLLECLTYLLNQGVDKDSCDSAGISALSHAVKKGREKLASTLIFHGADVNSRDNDGWTPIFYAVDSGNVKMVGLLKDAGANLYTVDRRGRTLGDVASVKDLKEVVEFLCGAEDIPQEVDINEKFKGISKYQLVLSELPDPSDRLSGFSLDVQKIINGIQLGHLSRSFQENNIQLGHFLTIDEKRLQEIGVKFWFDRKKIVRCVDKFYEQPWNVNSFGSTILLPELDLFHICQVLATITRQLYILNITFHSWRRRGGCSDFTNKEEEGMLRSCFTITKDIQKTLKTMEKTANRIEDKFCPIPPDLIVPKKLKSTPFWKPILALSVITIALLKFRIAK